jgi:hypothetical protein
MDHRDQVRQIISKLKDRALQDGIITEEEQRLLDTVQDLVNRYENYLVKAEADQIITPDEALKLREMRNQMLEGAWVEADRDAHITSDEATLLNLLLKLLKGIEYTTS